MVVLVLYTVNIVEVFNENGRSLKCGGGVVGSASRGKREIETGKILRK